ncbi:DUF2330 domain-containing protein [Brachybacterium phenoliresistens]|uniref:DUF2330 domain-containing protein n=1 Tax=Brachybacterium phenoliresistens TaxID=396014 RepID=UPI0031DA713A
MIGGGGAAAGPQGGAGGLGAAVRHLGLALLVLAAGVLAGAVAPAGACACGAMADPEDSRSDAAVTRETAVLSLREGTETIILSLELDAEAPGATLLMPTPAVPTVTEGDASTLREVAVATLPRVEHELDWWGEGRGGGDGAPGAGAGGAPEAPVTVHSRERVGDFEVAVLDGSAEGVSTWLSSSGYVLPQEVLDLLPVYVEDGWTFTAVRYAQDVDMSRDVSPLRFDFASDELVYPMRLSQAARSTQEVHLFVLDPEPVRRTDASAAQQSVQRPWIADPTHVGWTWSDGTLRELSQDGEGRPGRAMVTEFTIRGEPASFTTDMTFAADPADPWIVPTRTETTTVRVAGIPAGWVLVAAAGTIGVLVLYGAGMTALAVRRRRR